MAEATNSIPRSGFVTAVAWIFITLSGFATLIAILQNIMISLMFSGDMAREAGNAKDIPAFARFMFSHPRLIFGAFLAVSATTLLASIGLLRRSNWARLLFIGIMGLGILWNIVGMIFPFIMHSFMPPMPSDTPADVRDNFELMRKVMTAFTVLMALAFTGLFGWIMKRLTSPDIKREFAVLTKA